MKEKIFSILDSKSEVYSRPMYAATTEAGKRLMHQAVNAENSNYGGLYAADYTLFEIGVWDDNAGTAEMHKAQINLGNAATYVARPTQGFEMTNGVEDQARNPNGKWMEEAIANNPELGEILTRIGKEQGE